MKNIILLSLFLCLVACAPKIKKVKTELDGFYSWSTPFGGNSVKIEGYTFEFDSWSDVINHPSLEKYPFKGIVEIKGEKIYLKHKHLDERYNVYRVGIYKGEQYLIRELEYDDFLKNGIEGDGPYGQTFKKRKNQ